MSIVKDFSHQITSQMVIVVRDKPYEKDYRLAYNLNSRSSTPAYHKKTHSAHFLITSTHTME